MRLSFSPTNFLNVPGWFTKAFNRLHAMPIILKVNSMKSYSQNNSNNPNNEPCKDWDAFVDYLENVYFDGADETLEMQVVAFEYQQFKSYFS